MGALDVGLLALLGVGAVAVVALVEAAIRRTEVGAALVLGLLLVEEVVPVVINVDIGPVNVLARDVVFAVLLAAGSARGLRGGRTTAPQRLLLALGAVVLWSLVRGVGSFGPVGAAHEARRFVIFVAVAFYFSTLEPRRDLVDRIAMLWVGTAVALSAVTLVRWVANAAGLTGGVLGDGASLRVVPSDSALVIAQGALIALPLLADRRRGLVRYLTPALLAIVLLLQHRTVWIVAIVGLVALVTLDGSLRRQVIGALVAGAVILGGLTLTVFERDDAEVAEQLSGSARSTGTFEWRVDGWQALLRDSGPDGVEQTLLGRPFGSGWDRYFEGNLVTVSPHSFYLEPYLRVGALGVLLLVLVHAVALRPPGARRVASDDGLLSPAVLSTVVAVQLVYYVTYSPDLAQPMLLGIACAVASGRARAVGRAPSRDPSEAADAPDAAEATEAADRRG